MSNATHILDHSTCERDNCTAAVRYAYPLGGDWVSQFCPMGRLVVTLTDARPVELVKPDWPTVAAATDCDSPSIPRQANREWGIRVRQHADGRCVVYGWRTSQFLDERDHRAGELVGSLEECIGAVHRVGDHLGLDGVLVDECIGRLPVKALL